MPTKTKTFDDVLDEACSLANSKGTHYAAATMHNKYSDRFCDIYDRVYRYLVKMGYADTWK